MVSRPCDWGRGTDQGNGCHQAGSKACEWPWSCNKGALCSGSIPSSATDSNSCSSQAHMRCALENLLSSTWASGKGIAFIPTPVSNSCCSYIDGLYAARASKLLHRLPLAFTGAWQSFLPALQHALFKFSTVAYLLEFETLFMEN